MQTTATGRRRLLCGKGAEPTWPAYATDRGPRVLRGKGRVLALVAVGPALDDRGCGQHPDQRSGGAREQPRLVSRPVDARVGRRHPRPARAVSRQGRAVREAGARPVAPGRAPDPGAAGPRRRRRRAPDGGRRAARRRVRRGVPRGNDLAGPRADGRQVGHGPPRAARRRADHARRAVGDAPDPHEGPAAALAVGDRADGRGRRADRARAGRAREGDDRSDDGRDRRLCRPGPRALPGTRRRATIRGGGATPRPRARTGGPRDASRGRRRGVVGYGGGGDREPERADGVVGAPRASSRRASTPTTRTPTTCPASTLPAELRATADLGRGVRRRRRRRVRGAVARSARGARRGASARRARRARS